MLDLIDFKGWFLVIIQTWMFVFLAPLLVGWLTWLKCHLQNRHAPSLLQPYRNLWRLFHKDVLLPKHASLIFRMNPYIVAGVMLIAASIIPLFVVRMPSSATADVIVLVGFFALAKFFQSLAAMDIGTAFGGMGASREMTVSALAEPAMLMSVFTLAMVAHSTNLSSVVETLLQNGLVLRPSLLFAFAGLVLVAIAETGRIPVDNPSTHLELTMIHEAMVLEYSGRMLALIEWSSMTKLMIYGVLICNVFFPWGIALHHDFYSMFIGFIAIASKLMLLGIFLVVAETVLAKMRLFRVPIFLSLAFTLSLLGLLSYIILEVGS
jgi:formate hydrogenlyase subunit 4